MLTRLVGLLLVGVSAGCGAERPPAPAVATVVALPPPPPPPLPEAVPAAAAPTPPSHGAERISVSGTVVTETVGARPVLQHDPLAGPWNDLVRAQLALEASAGSCTAACRALGSMERAADQLCKLASSSEDAGRCDDARGKLIAARERVRTACGSCPGGPTVDPKAPAPSP
jgi:hypothetical protein